VGTIGKAAEAARSRLFENAEDNFHTFLEFSFEIIGVGANEWFEAAVGHAAQISNTDYTQLRIYFNHSDTINEYAGWYR
jgi:hypothetical protein